MVKRVKRLKIKRGIFLKVFYFCIGGNCLYIVILILIMKCYVIFNDCFWVYSVDLSDISELKFIEYFLFFLDKVKCRYGGSFYEIVVEDVK